MAPMGVLDLLVEETVGREEEEEDVTVAELGVTRIVVLVGVSVELSVGLTKMSVVAVSVGIEVEPLSVADGIRVTRRPYEDVEQPKL